MIRSNDATSLENESSSELGRIRLYNNQPALDKLAKTLQSETDECLARDAEHCWALLEKHGRKPLEILGAGSFGVVFRVRDSQLKRDVAVKVLRPSLEKSSNILSRFSFEARSAAQCNMEGVVPVFEYGYLDETPFIVSKYIEGCSRSCPNCEN